MTALRNLIRSLVSLSLGVWLAVFAAGLPLPAQALAGPVDWQPVTSTAEGQQWWDAGSLRINRAGNLTVLSRFLPAEPEPEPGIASGEGRPRSGELYVMEIDCGQRLFRDTAVNGIPQFGATWLAAADDDLISEVIEASCRAGAGLLQAG